MKLFKKVAALALAAAVSLSSFATAFAATSSPATAPATNESALTVKGHDVSTSEDGTATLKASALKTAKSITNHGLRLNHQLCWWSV